MSVIMLRAATYNLHFGGSVEHWAALRALQLDLVLAQETRRPSKAFAEQGWGVVWEPVAGQEWGSAVVSRLPIADTLSVSGFEGWVAGARLTIGEKEVAAFSVHTPTVKGRSYAILLGEILDAIRDMRIDVPMVLGGDFNLVSAATRAPEESIDMTCQEAGIIKRLLDQFELVSAWSSANPAESLPQTLRWARNPRTPYHCDVLYVPASWAQGISACDVQRGVEWDRLSDHNPVVLSIAVPNQSQVPLSP